MDALPLSLRSAMGQGAFVDTRNRSRGDKSDLQRWAERQAVGELLALHGGSWDGQEASGGAQSGEWEVTVIARAKSLTADEGDVELSAVESAVMRVVSDRRPMTQKQIAEATDYEDGEYIEKAIRRLWTQHKRLTKHADGWVRFDW